VHVQAAESEMVQRRMRTYGEPIDTDPKTALLNEVKRTAGHVAWLGQIVAEMEHKGVGVEQVKDADDKWRTKSQSDLVEVTYTMGMKPSVIVALYQDERKHLVRVCAEALRHGVEQALVDIAKQELQFVATKIRDILTSPELGLTPEQLEAAGVVTRRVLTSVE
jgi:hypothetical protein